MNFISITNKRYLNLKTDTNNAVPRKVIYLYLNPCKDDHESPSMTTQKLAAVAKQEIKQRHGLNTREWFYAEPIGDFMGQIKHIYEYCHAKLFHT